MRLFLRLAISLIFFTLIISNNYGKNLDYSNPQIDSLKTHIYEVSDIKKVDLLNQIAYNYYYYYHDSTKYYADEAVKLADSLGYTKGLSEAQRLVGIAYKAKNMEKEAIEWLYKGLETAQSINYTQGIADNLNSIGIFYNSIEDYNQAISFFKRSAKLQQAADNKLREGILLTNIAGIYLKKTEYDSSFYFYTKSIDMLDSIGDEKWIAMAYSQFAGLLIKTGKLDEAEDYTKEAEEISLRKGQTFHLRKCYQNLAEIHLLRKQYALAKIMAQKALKTSTEIGFIPFMIEAYEVNYKLSFQLKEYKNALNFHEKYDSYKDSLRMDLSRSEADLRNYEFELEKKENENLALRNEKENQIALNLANEDLIKRQSFLAIGISIILILVSILAFIFFKLRQKEHDTNTKLLESNNALKEQKEELSATLQMVEHLNAQLQAQNNTLNKIAIVSITDLEGNIINVNQNFCDVSGYSRDELQGVRPNILKSDEHSNEEFSKLWKSISEGNTWRGELKNKKKNGEFFWADTAIAPIFNDEGKPKQFFSLQFEITERKNYLNQLATKSEELEELNKLKDKLLSIVSHDFRSPLNSLRGTLTLFVKGAISNEELTMLTESLVEKLDNTYNLLDNLLNWAKTQMQGTKVYMKDIDLKHISEDCVGLLKPIADKKLLKLKNNIKTPLTAFADNEMIKLVIRNLLSNAIKFTTTGNEITLDAIRTEDKITVSLKDNGMGISNENQDKLFNVENFSTTGTSDEKGMGLGLLLCKDFIEKNHGEIWFESELEKGSTFYFTLGTKEPAKKHNLS